MADFGLLVRYGDLTNFSKEDSLKENMVCSHTQNIDTLVVSHLSLSAFTRNE